MLDGRLSEADRATVEAHVATCAACREGLEQLRATVTMLRALPEARAPRSFRVSVVRSATRAPGRRSLLVPFPGPALLRALAGIAAVLMVMVFTADAVRPALVTAPTADFRDGAAALAPAVPRPDTSAGEVRGVMERPGAPLAVRLAPAPEATPGDAAAPSQTSVAAPPAATMLPEMEAPLSQPPAVVVPAGASPPETGTARIRAPAVVAPPEARLPETVGARSQPPALAAPAEASPSETGGARSQPPALAAPAEARRRETDAGGQPPPAPGSWFTTGRLLALALGLVAIALLAVSFRRPAR